MSRILATPAELQVIGGKMSSLKNELMRHAYTGAMQAGFQKPDENAMASLMALITAAQQLALQSRQHYALFKALCSDMAASEADSVVTRALGDMGPEVMQ